MKRNLLALLLALVMVTGCIFALSPAVFAETADTDTNTTTDNTTGDTTTGDTTTGDTTTGDTTTGDTTTGDTTTGDTTTEESTEDSADAPAEETEAPFPEPLNTIFLLIIKFFKKILALLGL